MKGKNPLNKPSIRQTDVCRLLLKLGGEARWKDLKMHLDKLSWGPTTLKQTLDEAVKEGSVIKEARLGPKGPEAWYTVVIQEHEIWEPLPKTIHDEIRTTVETLKIKHKPEEYMSMEELTQLINEIKDTSMEQVSQRIRETAEQLNLAEREVFLKRQMRKITQLASEELQALIYLEARDVLQKGGKRASYTHSVLGLIFNNHLDEYLKILTAYPACTMKVLLDQMIKDEDIREEALRAEGLKT